jgi:hypothetical protein
MKYSAAHDSTISAKKAVPTSAGQTKSRATADWAFFQGIGARSTG